MIRALVWKDVDLHRRMIVVVLLGVALGFALALVPGPTAGVGLSLLMNVFIALFFYLPIRTIVEEQRDGTAVFVLSLPIRVEDYAIAKVLANLALFLVPAVAVGVAARLAPLGGDGPLASLLHSAWVPVILTGLLAVFAIVVAIALATGSMGWTVSTVVLVIFVLGNLVPRAVSHTEVGRRWASGITNGDPIVAVFLLAELGCAAGAALLAVRRVLRRRQYV